MGGSGEGGVVELCFFRNTRTMLLILETHVVEYNISVKKTSNNAK